MLAAILSYIPAAISVGVLGLVVILSRKTKPYILYFFISIIISLFILSQFIACISDDALALYFVRLGSLLTNILPLLLILFAASFTKLRIPWLWYAIISIPLIIFSFISFTDLIIISVDVMNYSFSTDVGKLYTLQTIILVAYFVAAIWILFNKYLNASGNQKNALRLMLIGFSIPVAANFVTNFIFIDNASVQFMGPLSLLILSAMVAYAIARHGLFDIRLLVVRALGYVLTITTVGLLYGFIAFGLVSAVFFEGDVINFWQQLVYTALAVILAFTFPPIKTFFDRITNRYFYRDAYDPQALIDNLNKILVSTVELDRLLSASADTIADQMKLQHCVFGVKETENTPRHIQGTKEINFEEADIAYLRELTPKMEETIISASNSDGLPAQAKKILRKYDIEVLARLVVQGEGIGYLLLGPRKSGSLFTDQDLRVISIIADEIAISIQNSLRFEEIEAFNITLQQKITAATDQLQKSNEKLKALDEAKDEFISMASHQLRTPLTSVKGYISMLLEGDAGKLTEQQTTFLDQAFLSSQRMVYLIADLLNVSRLKTGKFVIERRPVYLPDLVESEIAQLYETAKARELKLEFKAPKKFPMLSLDETKTRQVVMNFSDNAIYYTPKGGKIVIEVKEVGKSVQFTVTDNGIGVPKSEQHHLFSKFYRAGNAKKARPDGTGLGLFMAKKVIAAQGGAILFHTEEGKGSTFGFTFPLDKIEIQSSENT